MTIFFEDKFAANDDANWSNVTTAGGPITVANNEKTITDGGVTADLLGFSGLVVAGGVTLLGKILQCDYVMQSGTTQAIGLVGCSRNPGLDFTNALNVNFNSFVTPRFNYFDYGGSAAVGSQVLFEMNENTRYTVKFEFVSGGLVRSYITRYPSIINFPMGPSVIANDFVTGPVYLSAQQTFTLPSTGKTVWDNIYVHDEGLNFIAPDFQAEVDSMIASRTEIANLALSHAGIGKEIANIETENSEEARACRRYYDLSLETTLRDHDWPFATKYATLGLVEEAPNAEWDFSYRYPADCLKIRKILSGLVNDNRQSRIDFIEAQDDAGRLLLTNEGSAQVKYTPFTTNISVYPPDFVMALSFRLAHYIVSRLTAGDPFQLAPKIFQKYMLELSKAQANAGNEIQEEEHPESEYIRSRL